MRNPPAPKTTSVPSSSALLMRRARFDDVSEILRLIQRAVEHACRQHYGPAQRREVWRSYASNLYLDVLGPCETVVAEADGRLAAVAQLDIADSRLRALFVDAPLQARGVGGALLAEIERRALRRGCTRLHGAMSLNAVPFYARAGFHPSPGADRLTAAAVRVPVVRMEKTLRATT